MFKKIRSVIITLLLIVAADIAISYASSVPLIPDSPRPRTSSVPLIPDSPRPRTSSVPLIPDSPRPSSVPLIPDSPRP